MAIGATLAREIQQERQAGDEREAIWKPTIDVLSQTVGEAPLAIGAQQIASVLRDPGSTSAKLLGGIAGGFVPIAAFAQRFRHDMMRGCDISQQCGNLLSLRLRAVLAIASVCFAFFLILNQLKSR